MDGHYLNEHILKSIHKGWGDESRFDEETKADHWNIFFLPSSAGMIRSMELVQKINIRLTQVIKILSAVVVVLAIAFIVTQIIKWFGTYPSLGRFVRQFNMDGEANIPTYFSSIILFICALLLGIIAALKKREHDAYTSHWTILSIIFVFMSLDEVTSYHGCLAAPVRKLLNITQGPFLFAWVIPGAALVLVFAMLFWRFLFHLPRESRLLFSVAAIVYVGGALGMEFFGGYYAGLHGIRNFNYNILVLIEETLEMLGVILFIYALKRYIKSNFQRIQIDIV